MEITAGLAKSNNTIPPGRWLEVTCGLTACTPELTPGPTLGKEYGGTLFLPYHGIYKTTFAGIKNNDCN